MPAYQLIIKEGDGSVIHTIETDDIQAAIQHYVHMKRLPLKDFDRLFIVKPVDNVK